MARVTPNPSINRGEIVSSASKVRFGLWFDFRNPPQWRRPYEDVYAETIEQVVWAEGLGYEGAWLSEHHFAPDGYSPSPVVIAAAIAMKTKRMRIGTNVLLLPLYHPVRLAEDCATVHILSRGRFELGVGLGYRVNEFVGYGIPYNERAGRTNEGLGIIRRLWEGERSPSTASIITSRVRVLNRAGAASAAPDLGWRDDEGGGQTRRALRRRHHRLRHPGDLRNRPD